MIRFLLGLILSVVGIPIILIVLLLDFSPNIPVEYYETVPMESIIQEELNNAIAGIDQGELAVSISEENINKLIYNAILEGAQEEGSELNPNYDPTGTCEGCEYIFFEEIDVNGQAGSFGVTGLWVEFYEDVISLNVSVKGDMYASFQTRVRFEFEVADNDDSYTVTYSRFKVGSIPLPKSVVEPVVNFVIEQTSMETTQLNTDLYQVDLANLTVRVDKNALVAEMAEDPSAQAGLELIFDNKLVTLDVFEEPARFEVYVDVDKMSVDSAAPVMDASTFNMEDEMTRQMNNVMLSVFAGDPQVVISEETLNAVVSQAMGDINVNEMIPVGEAELDIALEGFWLEMEGNTLEVNFQLSLGSTQLLLELDLVASERNGDLVFTVQEAFLGRDAGEAEAEYITIPGEDITALAAGMTMENELFSMDMSVGELVISNEAIAELISASSNGISIESISMEDGSIIIAISLPQQEEIQALVEEVTEVLDTFEEGLDFVDETKPEEVAFEEAVQDIAQSIDVEAGQVDIDEEDLEELVDLYAELDPETQEEFIDLLEESIDPAVMEDFLNTYMGS